MRSRKKSLKIFSKAEKVLVGGVNSPVRAFNYVGGKPLIIKKGKGAKVYDFDGNEYIDYVLSWGSLVLGHGNRAVTRGINRAASDGTSFGATNIKEIELARIICSAVPTIEKVRFVNSGTEAVMGAVRLARGYTGRDKIVKFENSYHGHADYLLTKGGSGLATLNIPQSEGIPVNFVKETIVIPSQDEKLLNEVFKRYGKKIAAVIVEPVGGNYGVIPPDIDFMRRIRSITKRYKTLFISDEVITGFRFSYGSILDKFGIKPDLICLGKIIGGGLPIGAFGGKNRIMNHLAPLGKVYQASTFAGNPVVMASGIATLKVLKRLKKDYKRLENLTEYLSKNLKEEARKRGMYLKVSRFGSAFSLKFKNKEAFKKFYGKILRLGVFFAPSEFEANFLSFAHTKKDINKTLESARKAFDSLKGKI